MTMFKKPGSAVGRLSSATPPSRGGGGISRSSIAVYTSGTSLTPPDGAKFMRVAAIGPGEKGGSSSADGGGGGGGCAATKIVPAQPITYTIGANIYGFPNWVRTPTTVSFGDRTLTAFGAVGRNGGYGSGGDYNFNGGNASTSSNAGGGSAGPAGHGGAAGSPAPAMANNGWSIGGGGGGASNSSVGGGAPGCPGRGGAGAGGAGQTIFGSVNVNNETTGMTPGGGGGVGAIYTATAGAMIVEWFFDD